MADQEGQGGIVAAVGRFAQPDDAVVGLNLDEDPVAAMVDAHPRTRTSTIFIQPPASPILPAILMTVRYCVVKAARSSASGSPCAGPSTSTITRLIVPVKRKGAAVRLGDRQAAVVAAAQAFAGRLDDGGDRLRDLALSRLFAVHVECPNALVLPGPTEVECQCEGACRQIGVCADPVFGQPDVVVDVVQAAILDVQRVASEPASVRQQDTLRAALGDARLRR